MTDMRAGVGAITDADIAWLQENQLASPDLIYLDDVIDQILVYRSAIQFHLSDSALPYAEQFFFRLQQIRAKDGGRLGAQKAEPIPPDTRPIGFCKAAPLFAAFFVDGGSSDTAEFILRELLVAVITLSGLPALRKIALRNFAGYRTLVDPVNQWWLDCELDRSSVANCRHAIVHELGRTRMRMSQAEPEADDVEMRRRLHIRSACANLKKILQENSRTQRPRTIDRRATASLIPHREGPISGVQGISWHDGFRILTTSVPLPSGRSAHLRESWRDPHSRHDPQLHAAEPPASLEACRPALALTDETGLVSPYFSIKARRRAEHYLHAHLALRNQLCLLAPGALTRQQAPDLVRYLEQTLEACDDVEEAHAVYRLMLRVMMGVTWPVLERVRFERAPRAEAEWAIREEGALIQVPIRRPPAAYVPRGPTQADRLTLADVDAVSLKVPTRASAIYRTLSHRFARAWTRVRHQQTVRQWRFKASAVLDRFAARHETELTIDGLALPVLGAMVGAMGGVEWMIPWLTGETRYRTTPQEYYGTVAVTELQRCHRRAIGAVFGDRAFVGGDCEDVIQATGHVGSRVSMQEAAYGPLVAWSRNARVAQHSVLSLAEQANHCALDCLLRLLAHTAARGPLAHILKPYCIPGPALYIDDKVTLDSGNVGPYPTHQQNRDALDDYLAILDALAAHSSVERRSRTRLRRIVMFYSELWTGSRGAFSRSPNRARDTWPDLFQCCFGAEEGSSGGALTAVPVSSLAGLQALCELVWGDGALRHWMPNQLRAQLFSLLSIAGCPQSNLNQLMRHAPRGRGTLEPTQGRPVLPGEYVASDAHYRLVARFCAGRGARKTPRS